MAACPQEADIDSPASPRSIQIPALTGLRGLAALWVMGFHISYLLALPITRDVQLIMSGEMGVDLFFILSGFVLMHTHSEDFRTLGAGPTIRFWLLRATRIYPVATAVLVLILLLVTALPVYRDWYRVFHAPNDLTPLAFVQTLLLATRWWPPFNTGVWNEPIWSLSAEILGYVCFPVLSWIVLRCTVRWPLVALVLVLAGGVAAEMVSIGNGLKITWFGVVRMAALFPAGMLLWQVLRLRDLGQRPLAVAGWVAVALVIGAAFLPMPQLPLMAVLVISIACCTASGNPISWLCSTRLVLYLGRISFPLYLVHLTPILVLRMLADLGVISGWVELAATLATLALIFGLAHALHRFVERPVHDWARQRFGVKAAAPQPQ